MLQQNGNEQEVIAHISEIQLVSAQAHKIQITFWLFPG